MKILVAEDDKFLQNIYKVKLVKAGYEVTVVENGKIGLEQIKTTKFDLILLDLIMPVMDGFALLQEIRKDALNSKTPVVITSNLGQQEDIEKGKQLGATDYIVKSDTPLADLLTKIDGILKANA